MRLRSSRLGVNAAIALAKRLDGVPIAKLDLYDNLIRDVGCMAVLKLCQTTPHISHLNLGANDIGSEGALAIAEEMSRNRTICSLELGSIAKSFHSNYLDSISTAALASALVDNGVLKYLGLRGNVIAEGGL
ncbi:hypothetical protein KIPB_008632, partial [Kipferlia bialata]|eukprot:g8632.t1